MNDDVRKFDAQRAGEYGAQSRIALAGYDACHELTACLLAATLGRADNARILVVGAGGTGGELQQVLKLRPSWHLTAVDPSEPMLQAARTAFVGSSASTQISWHAGELATLDMSAFDAAIMIGVLHHVAERNAKVALLEEIGGRVKTGGPFILAGNHRAYDSEPLFLSAWQERWMQHGFTQQEAAAKLATIQFGARPPETTEEVVELLHRGGFENPKRFFSSLFWGAWIAFKSGSQLVA